MSAKTPNVLFRAQYYTKDSKEYGFYSSRDSSNDYLNYVSTGAKSGKVRDYLDYAGNEEKSSGAFSSKGLLTPKEKKEIREGLKNTKAQIWSCLLSFEEQFGKEHLKSWLDAKEIIEKEFPKFLKENNIRYDNIVWFAGMHENTDNRHIHICFFEKEPLRITSRSKEPRFHEGTLKRISMENLKIRVEQRMSGIEYDIKSSRNEIISKSEEYLNQAVNSSVAFDKTVKEKLIGLYRRLPNGNFGYESHKLDAYRDEIDDITTHYLMNDAKATNQYVNLLRKLSESDRKTKELCEAQHIDYKPHMKAEKFRKDLYRRIGNRILKHIRDARTKESSFLYEISLEKKKRYDEKKRMAFLLGKVASLSKAVYKDRNDIFDEFERLLQEAEYEKERKGMEAE